MQGKEANCLKRKNLGLLSYAVTLGLIILIAVIFNSNMPQAASKRIEYPELLRMIERDEVAKVAIRDQSLWGLKRRSNVLTAAFPEQDYDFETTIGEDFLLTVRQMAAEKKGKDVSQISVADLTFDVQYRKAEETSWLITFLPFILEILIFGVLIFMFLRANAGAGRAMHFGKSNPHIQVGNESKVTFADVAGADEEKEELQEMVDFLRNPRVYTSLGARVPKGALLVGPPGTGKTLLAKAVAGEAGVPFFSISGSDFVEMYVGVGASRVRDLFEQAKHVAPAIVFIDEIDAVGRRRGAGLGGGHDEREQTLNQLLVEMDGFAVNEGIIVMAATNRRDILDPALMRPGRFDRQVTVNYPDLEGRVAILKVHARGKPLADDVDFENLAKRLPYGAGADLENVMNEAAILTARARKKQIDQQTLIDAIARVQMGPEKHSHKVSEKDKRMVAVHEAGHAVVGHMLDGCDEVHLVTIVPRGRSAGHTLSLPSEEHDNMSRSQLIDMVAMALGGHAAEEVILGEIYTGSSSDLQSATEMCRQMVTKYGMSDKVGTMYLGSEQEVFVGMEFGQSREYSENVAALIDAETKKLLDMCYERAKQVIRDHEDALQSLVSVLLKEQTVGRNTFVAIMEGRTPEEAQDHDLPREAPPVPKAEPRETPQSEDRPQLPSSFVPEDSL